MKKVSIILLAIIHLFFVETIIAQQLKQSKIDTKSSKHSVEKINENQNLDIFIIDTIQQNNTAFLESSNENLERIDESSRPKVSLPFYVYKEGDKLLYTPSGLMGNYQDLTVETKDKKSPYTGEFSIRISYNSNSNWYGVAMVNPADDWGSIDGGYDISGAKTYSFWARTSEKNVKAKIGFGMIGRDKKFPDTARLEKEFKLSTKWKKYSFNLKKLDLTRIRTGFVLFSGGIGKPYEIFIDDIVFE